MKKITALFLAVFMVFAFAACAGNSTGANPSQAEPDGSISTEANVPDSGTASEGLQANDSREAAENGDSDGSKVLVAYFSATGTTKGIAQTIADSVGAELYEITPEQPYTDADLDYHGDNSRSTIEMNDPAARPAISGTVENMAQYDIVFIGYPIWWGDAPRILSTFVESYDLSGKTIVPFCTSGSSGIGSSAKNLECLSGGATWISGTRFNGGASRSAVVEWINSLGLSIAAQ